MYSGGNLIQEAKVTAEKAILTDLVAGLESLALTVDSIEAVLSRKGLCTIAEIQGEKGNHLAVVANRLAAVRLAIQTLE
jgi:hypothetical protein